MPVYEYECENGHRFEEWHRIEDRYNAVCRQCGKPVRIKISLSSFRMDVPVTFRTHDGTVIDRKSGGINAPIGRPNDANITMV